MQIQNEEATRIIRDGAKLTLAEGFPAVLLPNVVPVMDMTPDFHKVYSSFSGGTAGTGSTAIYTGQSKKRFCITGALYSFVKDAACDVATGGLTVTATVGGVSKTIINASILTLTAQSQSFSVNFDRPIITDEGSSVISASASFTVGTMRRNCVLYGYEIDAN